MRILFAVCAVLTVTASACSETYPEPWSTTAKVEGALLAGAICADMLSTALALNTGTGHETNFIMGEHPSDKTIALFGLGVYVIEMGIAELLPAPARESWLAGLIAAHGAAAGLNFQH
jgi:hypothetical protein